MLAPQADRLNRPGLAAINYRIGNFASFRRAMLESISSEPLLASLTTRAQDDYAVTFIELFAAMGDVLTFYNERIANELFLRTARERDSVLRQVRLIGYRLRPGLAATTMLSFELDAGAETRIRNGLKVMSVPGQDERPQIFETLEQIAAHADLNATPAFPQPVPFQAFRQGSTSDPLASRPDPLTADDRFLIFGLGMIEEKRVATLIRGSDGERLDFDPAIQTPSLWPGVARAAKVLRRLRFFGHNAPLSRYVFEPASPPAGPIWQSKRVPGKFDHEVSFYPLDGRYDDLQPGAQLLVDAGDGQHPRLRTAVVTAVDDRAASIGDTQDSVTHVTLRQTILGRPALASHPRGGHEVVALSGTGAVQHLDSGAPRRWVFLNDAEFAADVAITLRSGGRPEVLIRDASRKLRHRSGSLNGESFWVDHGGFLTSEPRPLIVDAALRVFARGAELGLWMIDVTSGAPGVWMPLGGALTSAPAPVALPGGGIAVFVRWVDRALWVRRYDGATWSDWQSLGGILASGPSVASTGDGRIDVVACDDHGALIHRRFDGAGWSGWRNLGGHAVGEPAIVGSAHDRIDILVRTPKSELAHIARNGVAWTAWTGLEGKLGSDPAVIRDRTGLHVYARGTDGAIVQRTLTVSAWRPWVAHGDGLGHIYDRRATRIYETSARDIVFREFDYPDEVVDGRVALRLQGGRLEGYGRLTKDRRILLRSGDALHLAKVTATRPWAAQPGEAPDHLLVDFTPTPPKPLTEVTLLGNVAEASHGETQPDEALGHGDAATPFQTARLQRSPLTYLPSATSIAGEAALEVRVNGERWSEVPSLYSRKPAERVYTARQNDKGETILTFGDGQTGARLPSGAMNVTARYRKGLGLEGRVKAGQLSMPLERPPGLRTVGNPLPADGGADPETRDDARAAASATVRTFGRAVSLLDFEWLAMTSGLVARAHVTWVWHELERAVHLTVAAAGGQRLSSASLTKLHSGLRFASDPNRPLFLANLVRVPLVLKAKVVPDPAREADAVREAARAAVLDFLAFERIQLGLAVHVSRIFAAIQGAQGVVAVNVDVFQLKGYADLTPIELAMRSVTAAPLQKHIRIFPARPSPLFAQIDRFARAGFDGTAPPPVLAAEQAYVEVPATDVEITLVEAL
jgi:hypothetical protein